MSRCLSLTGRGLVATIAMLGVVNAPSAFAAYQAVDHGQMIITTRDYWPTPETETAGVFQLEPIEGIELYETDSSMKGAHR
jgi:hypothetical protein